MKKIYVICFALFLLLVVISILIKSYKLDAIAEHELGDRKVDYGNTNLSSLADEDWSSTGPSQTRHTGQLGHQIAPISPQNTSVVVAASSHQCTPSLRTINHHNTI